MIVPLYVSSENRKVAVLTPREVRILEEYMNADYKIRTRFLLHTAMRIAEAKYVDLNRNAFRKENGAIFLPKVKGLGKKKCTISNRTVLLSHVGVSAVEDFFDKNVHLPSYQAMEQALKLAAKTWGDIRQWSVVLVPLLAAGAWLAVRARRATRLDVALPLGMLMIYFLINVFHYADLGWQMGSSWNRLTAQALPLLCLAVISALSRRIEE